MKNPTPGKNPFELESYRDTMPLHVRELYDDMTRNYAKLQGRAGLGRFWRFWAFAVCYLALLMVISDTTTDTILVFVGLVLCGWLYIAVPSFTISVRRLHDDGKPDVLRRGVLCHTVPQAVFGFRASGVEAQCVLGCLIV